MVRLQAFSLWLYWEWTSSWVFLDLCWNVQNYPFCRTTLGGWFHMSILSKWHISERNILYYSNIKVFILLWDILLLYLLAWSVDVALLIQKTWADICLETSFDEGSCCIETSELICRATPLTSFCVVLVFAEICFGADIKELHLCFYYSQQESYGGCIRSPVRAMGWGFCIIS